MLPLLKKPSAWIPIATPLVFFVVMLVALRVSGPPAPDADEGTLAHLFQIWLVFEMLAVLFFAIKWLPQRPAEALLVLALQIATSLAVIAPVFILKL